MRSSKDKKLVVLCGLSGFASCIWGSFVASPVELELQIVGRAAHEHERGHFPPSELQVRLSFMHAYSSDLSFMFFNLAMEV